MLDQQVQLKDACRHIQLDLPPSAGAPDPHLHGSYGPGVLQGTSIGGEQN